MEQGWHLAQINVGRLTAPSGDPQVAGFFAELDRINALADASPGFVWRLQSDSGNATDIQVTDDPLFILNMSVWTDAEALFAFVYRSAHTPVMAQRRDWFGRFDGAYQALWWIPAGTIPTIDEGLSRLWRLDRFGPSRDAFTFKTRFPSPNQPGAPFDMQPDPWCVGRA
ncbi:DUF3291 domain-containing protein [Sphingomonas sp.]|jgi:hypothetical protein|uniref:DUF3291 domain-containing protein n=1 Tax=Sphingomonas sp. TaxID=28214 RepID=UPI002DF4C34A|nr:DUF3291 domain-containing protein [Sphingomonas sp.]